MTARAGFAPGSAREDWMILRALSDRIGHTLPYDTIGGLRAAMYRAAPHLARLDAVEPASGDALSALAMRGGQMGGEPFAVATPDYYLTNPIARASAVMAELSVLKRSIEQGASPRGGTGTHG